MNNLRKITIFLGFIATCRADYDRTCENGECKPISQCSYIQELLRQDSKAFLKNFTTICGFQDKIPLICCAPIKSDGIKFDSETEQATLRPIAASTEPTSTSHVPSTTYRVPASTTYRVPASTERQRPAADHAFTTPLPPTNNRVPEYDASSSSITNKHDDLVEIPNNKLPSRDVCGTQTSDDIFDRIVGGDLTKLSEFPWTARIKYSHPSKNDSFLCGGTLISDQYILTAAHCLTSKDYKVIGVRLGEWNVETDIDCDMEHRCAEHAVDIPLARIISHSEFSRITYHSDIALLQLIEPVKYTEFIRPICLPNTATVANLDETGNASYWAAGWGKTEYGTVSPIKRKVLLKHAPTESCKDLLRKATDDLLPKIICAGGQRGADSCTGDSGGPLMQSAKEGPNVNWYLYGIISLGKHPCGIEGQPAVYTRITKYLDWIMSVIG